jgi:hypothetical protein
VFKQSHDLLPHNPVILLQRHVLLPHLHHPHQLHRNFSLFLTVHLLLLHQYHRPTCRTLMRVMRGAMRGRDAWCDARCVSEAVYSEARGRGRREAVCSEARGRREGERGEDRESWKHKHESGMCAVLTSRMGQGKGCDEPHKVSDESEVLILALPRSHALLAQPAAGSVRRHTNMKVGCVLF